MNFFTQSEKRKSTMAWSKRAELLTTILWLIKRLIVKKPQQALFTICRKKVLQFRYLWNFSTVSQVCNTWSPTFLRIYFLLSCFRQAQDFVIFKGPKIFFSNNRPASFSCSYRCNFLFVVKMRYQIWCNKLFWKTVVWIFQLICVGLLWKYTGGNGGCKPEAL